MLSDEPTFVYSPRSLLISSFDDFTYIYPSKQAIKLNNNITDNDIKEAIKDFENYKRMNDLILKKKYFK